MSLEVPRLLAPGVVWDEVAEAAYLSALELFIARGMTPARADQEARWSVELSLHRRLIGEQVRAGLACRTPADKRTLYRWWVSKLGQTKADELAALTKERWMADKVKGWV